MTTFQDPRPQSRRAVRQNEREESTEPTGGFTQEPPAGPQFYSDPSAPNDMWDTTARRAAQISPAAPSEDAPPARVGRRAAAPVQSVPAVAEPLTYSTQARPQIPSYDGPSFRNRVNNAPQQDVADLPPTEAIPQIERPAYRVRDFSPGARRAALAAPAWNPPTPFPAPGDLEYHTEARPDQATSQEPPATVVPAPVPVASLPVEAAPAPAEEAPQEAPAAAVPTPVQEAPAPAPAPQQLSTEHTMSRRELRALRAAPAAEDRVPELQSPPLVAPEPSTNTALTDALAEFDALTGVRQGSAPATDPDDATPWTPPFGHWSTQADLDDESQPHEGTINRTISSGTTATNALVLPNVPQGNDIRGPLTSTGEIMLTGSIDLPHSFSSTGASDRFDHDGLDALFDVNDSEVVSTDSAPVRAIRAVSTHSSGHGVTHTQKPKGNRVLVGLLIAASSMAVVVAGLLVAAFAFNVF